MTPIARRQFFACILLPLFVVAFGRGAEAQKRGLDVCGDVTARAAGKIASMVEEGGALSIVPGGAYERTCSQISGIRYTGARARLSDCEVGKRFTIVGDLRPSHGKYILEGNVIRCEPAIESGAASDVVASPQIQARVERLNDAYSGVSLTSFDSGGDKWSKTLFRGRAIAIDANASLHLKYETCASGSLVQGRSKSNPVVTTQSSCATAGDWLAQEVEYPLASIKLPTVAVREKSAPVGSNWFELEFSSDHTAQLDSISCPGREACNSMAEDLSGLVTVVQALRAALARANEAYRGLVLQQQASSQDQIRIVTAKTEAIRANLSALHTHQQVCVRRPDQDCDRDQLWRERIALVDPSKLAPEVTLDEMRFASDDKTMGGVMVKCASAGCWNVRTGGSGGNISSGRPQEEIHCRIGDGCRTLKRELEQLVALVQGKGTSLDGRPDAHTAPGQVDGGRAKESPIIGDATMTEDRTIVVQMRRTADGKNVSGVAKYAVGDPHYHEVLNHLGGMNPGDNKPVPAWKSEVPTDPGGIDAWERLYGKARPQQ
jgi:hypothetical protein